MLERLFPGAQHLQNPHPLVVHFPIAFLYGAALLYLIAWIARRETLAWCALWMMLLGVISAGASIASGLYALNSVMVAPSVRENVLRPHMWTMLAASSLALLLAAWALLRRPLPSSGRIVFMAGLLVMVLMIAKGADWGGQMVYDYNAGGGACSQPIDYNPHGSPAM